MQTSKPRLLGDFFLAPSRVAPSGVDVCAIWLRVPSNENLQASRPRLLGDLFLAPSRVALSGRAVHAIWWINSETI